MNTTPPPIQANNTVASAGKPFYLPSIIVACVGLLPLLIYLIACIALMDSGYRGGGSPILIILMGFIGFVLHGVGLICGVVAIFKGGKIPAYIGSILNVLILIAIFLLGFLAFVIG